MCIEGKANTERAIIFYLPMYHLHLSTFSVCFSKLQNKKSKDLVQCAIQIFSLQLCSEARGVQTEMCPCRAVRAESERLCSVYFI